jgi:hypothetical protein
VTRGELRRAAELFNAGEYHAAHEVLDELWESTHGEAADFYKGLLQACIAMHHYSRANLDGARKLYRGHRQYLAPYLPSYLELDVQGFLASMQATLQPVVRARPGGEPAFEPAKRPRLEFVEPG